MSHTLPNLPYAYNALEPHFDAETMEIHHSKHHQAYITNYTGMLEGSGMLEKYSPEEILAHTDEVPEEKRQGVINNVGGHINHSFFWTILSPVGGGEPEDELAEAINSTFGSLEGLKDEFNAKAASVFGAGWAWLVKDASGNLKTKRTSFQDSPLSDNCTPILGLDVWEHAYYLKYQNRRPEYINAFWNVVNWEQANEYYIS